jgi:endo-1,4-beta-D-glucanase Y
MDAGLSSAGRGAPAVRWAALLFLTVLAGCTRQPTTRELLDEAWQLYKTSYVTPEGEVVDQTRGGGETISEAQGYALLRAVWSCDEATFDRVRAWTDAHLRRPDGLYAWRWSSAAARILDANTAADADQEIALALLQGSVAFSRPELEREARRLIRAIRAHEALALPDGWFPAAGNWAVEERIANLSYFLPYAYRDFDRIDPQGRWGTVLSWGYRLLGESLQRPGALLPPDFMVLSPSGEIEPLPADSRLSPDFSFDAMRCDFRVALDCWLYGAPEACSGALDPRALWALRERDGEIATAYSVEGKAIAPGESLSFYGSLLPALALRAPAQAKEILRDQLSPRSLEPVLRATNRYYDLNWIWFGLAAEDGLIAERWNRACPASDSSAAQER